jgi:glycosyltransferase involved in cell wall biosynthesis
MTKTSIATLHYTAPPIVGGVEAVILAHLDVFLEHGLPSSVIAGRGDGDSFPGEVPLHRIPMIDSQHPDILKATERLNEGEIPENFEDLTSELVSTLSPLLRGADNLIVHNIFTKHFNLPLTAALDRLLDQRVIHNCLAWCHDFTWTSPTSRENVHPGYPWDLLRTRRDDVEYIVVSQRRQRALADLFECPEDEIHVIYNGVDPQTLLGLSETSERLIQRIGLLESDLILLMPVRVTRAKNIEFALKVVAVLKKQGVNPKLVLTGPPDPHDSGNMEYYHSLQTLREELGVVAEMSFVYESGPQAEQGYTISTEIVGDLIRASDVVFMPSHREGFGMPILEAGLAGTPVFCTDIPAANEIGGDDLFIFDLDDGPEKLAEHILQWADEDPVHRLRRRIRHRFTWEALFQREIRPLLKTRESS